MLYRRALTSLAVAGLATGFIACGGSTGESDGRSSPAEGSSKQDRLIVTFAERPKQWLGDLACELPFVRIDRTDLYDPDTAKLVRKDDKDTLLVTALFTPRVEEWQVYAAPKSSDPLQAITDAGVRLALAKTPAGLRNSTSREDRRALIGVAEMYFFDPPAQPLAWLDVDIPSPLGGGVYRFRVMREAFGSDWKGYNSGDSVKPEPAKPHDPDLFKPPPAKTPATKPTAPDPNLRTLRPILGKLPLGTSEKAVRDWEDATHSSVQDRMVKDGTILLLTAETTAVLLAEWADVPILRVKLVNGLRKGELLYCRKAHLKPPAK